MLIIKYLKKLTWFISSRIKKKPKKMILICTMVISYTFCLPTKLFETPYTTVIESCQGDLLGAKIAFDGQWRFPNKDSIPTKFKQCILQFEDAHFNKHLGFNPISIIKALIINLKKGRIVRGGSTITQQVIRLSRKGQKRTYLEKIYELILATRLEIRNTKSEILNMYIAHAPFGGNVVGLQAASWRYFGIDPYCLSWAESATLAVLPNAPSLINLGKNRTILLKKRNLLLQKLYLEKIIDKTTYKLSTQEKLPVKPYPLPQLAPHLLQQICKSHLGKQIQTSISTYEQKLTNKIAKKYYQQYKENSINNIALLVLDVETKKVRAYTGNSPTSKEHQKDVDIIQSKRSTGSVLKPLLYMAMLDKGELLPNTLVPDIPTNIAGYCPENYNKYYTGAIRAKVALAKSLNVPAVRMLHKYGLIRFYDELKYFNFKTINKSANHYGLTLILGGAESTLWDMSSAYMNLAGTVNSFNETNGKYFSGEFQKPSFLKTFKANKGNLTFDKTIYDAGSIFLGLEAMKEVNRPKSEAAWKFYDSSQQIAWKTGTSFGNRDAWAIGVTKKYVVGVWVGNADGEGRPNLTGIDTAAPILFDLFSMLPKSQWFTKPLNAMEEFDICEKSGYLASPICKSKKELLPVVASRFTNCPYHHLVHLSKDEKNQVNASCEEIENIVTKSWFTLPPIQEWYYKKYNSNYKKLPEFKKTCKNEQNKVLDFIYPLHSTKIIMTRNEYEKLNPIICKVAHRDQDTKIHWYINDTYITTTQTFHQIPITPPEGISRLTAIDEKGNQTTVVICVEK